MILTPQTLKSDESCWRYTSLKIKSEREFAKDWMINFAKRKVVANRYLSALDNCISVLSYFQVEQGCGDHLASILNFNVGLITKIIYATCENLAYQPKLLDSIKRTD